MTLLGRDQDRPDSPVAPAACGPRVAEAPRAREPARGEPARRPVSELAAAEDAVQRASSPQGHRERDERVARMRPADRERGELLREGVNCTAIATADRAAVVIDGMAYFDAFRRAAERARRSIVIVGWDFDSRTPLAFDEQHRPTLLLGDFLNRLAQERRRLRIRVLDWDYPMVFGLDREFPPYYGLNWTPHRHIRFRYDDTHPVGASHHQKIVLIDDRIAFVGGLDLTSKRWDTPEHDPRDGRRMSNGKRYPPFHDMMVLVDGDAARRIGEVVRERWYRATGERIRPVRVTEDPWPPGIAPIMRDVRTGVARTVPEMPGRTTGVRDIEQLYFDMIAGARRYIYIENQYFTSPRIGEALAARLQEDDPPEIVLLTRLLSHGVLEEATMTVLRARLVRMLQDVDRHGRFQAYYPHVDGLEQGTCIDLHSKLMIVDDEWLRIGSSNLSNRSMGFDTECDVLLDAQGDEAKRAAIRGVRDTLLAEHLGCEPAAVTAAIAGTPTLHEAIASLRGKSRTLEPLDDLPDYPPGVLDTAAAIADPERPATVHAVLDELAPVVSAPPGHPPVWKPLALLLVASLLLALAWRYTPLADVFTVEHVTAWASAFSGQWWAPAVIVLSYVPSSVLMFPRPLITLASVVAFGPWLGFTYSMTGVSLSAALSYLLGAKLPEPTVRRLAGQRLTRVARALRRRGIVSMTALRLVPLAPFIVLGVVAGAIRIRLFDFLAGTVLGMLPGMLTATVFGDQLQAAIRDPALLNRWLVVGVVGFFALTTWGARRVYVRAEARAAAEPSR